MKKEELQNAIDTIEISEAMKSRLKEKCIEEMNTMTNTNKGHRFTKRGKILLVAATVAVMGTVTVGATALVRWNNAVADHLGANDKQQEQLVEENVAQVYDKNEEAQEIMSTDNGVTVKLEQTVQDSRYIYAYFKVTAPEDVDMTNELVFEEACDISFLPGLEAMATPNIGAGFLEYKDGEETNVRYYYITVLKAEGYDFSNRTMHVNLKNLMDDQGKLEFTNKIEGTWQMDIPLDFADSTKYYELNERIDFGGNDITIKNIEVSPISYSCVMDGTEYQAACDNGNVNLDELDSLSEIVLNGVRLKDGTIMEVHNNSGSETFDENGENYTMTFAFDRMVDVDNIVALIFGEQQTEVNLVK